MCVLLSKCLVCELVSLMWESSAFTCWSTAACVCLVYLAVPHRSFKVVGCLAVGELGEVEAIH